MAEKAVSRRKIGRFALLKRLFTSGKEAVYEW